MWFPDETLRDVIMLDPQWHVDVFKTLITSPDFVSKRPELREGVATLLMNGTVSYTSLCQFWSGYDVQFLIQMMQKFDLLFPVGSSEEAEPKFCIPCILPKKEVDHVETSLMKGMKMAFKSEHRSKFEELFFIGTFTKLLVACSKCWAIGDKMLSCQHAAFTINSGMLLDLAQPHRSTITATVWCNPGALDKSSLGQLLQVRRTVESRMAVLGIPSASRFELLCPHWRPQDPHPCTIPVMGREAWLQPCVSECSCHREPVLESDLAPTPGDTRPQQPTPDPVAAASTMIPKVMLSFTKGHVICGDDLWINFFVVEFTYVSL